MTRWDASDMPDLTGRVALVTGANSGLGLHTSVALAHHGARVVLACRNPARASAAEAAVSAAASGPAPVAMALDLSDLQSVADLADQVAARFDHLDLLINNAGVMALPPMRSADGFELQFATNHLGHFALTARLAALMETAANKTPGPRVVTVSSIMARRSGIRFDDLQGEGHYDPWQAYGQSKRANLLFAFELDRRARSAGMALRSVAAHPGWSATRLSANGPGATAGPLGRSVLELANRTLAQPGKRGALPILYAATGSDITGGDYTGPAGPLQLRGAPTRVRGPRGAYDLEVARRLWQVSEELTGVGFLS
ncbi:MAG: oxidoreductase [Acidimicrobiales bacterium]